ncbi:MAG: glycosyltransferase family 9 protein [Spirochaetales bacterium]|nr:glycosyltransferase family 9 protein [Spirochaetales bacterium]
MGDRGNRLLRWGDRYLGIPLVYLAGLFRSKRELPRRVERIGILATAAIGDTLLLSAVLKDLQAALPQGKFTLFCGASIRGILDMSVEGMEFVPIPIRRPFKAARTIRKESFDLFIDCGPWPRLNSLLTFASRSACTIGFHSLGQGRHYVYDIPVEHRRDCHELDNLRRLLTPLGIESVSQPFLGQAESDRENPYAVVHMFPSGYKARYKEWSDDRWIRLMNGLTERGIPLVVTGGPVDEERAGKVIALCDRGGLIRNGAGKSNLAQTGEILRKAVLVISVNTGIMHMAAAYGQRVVALHGPTSVRRWGPVSSDAVNFTATSPSAGCLHLGFEYDRRDSRSLDTIDPDRVLELVLALWEERSSS